MSDAQILRPSCHLRLKTLVVLQARSRLGAHLSLEDELRKDTMRPVIIDKMAVNEPAPEPRFGERLR